jgi:tetratricopeptide (TPR) repeat protein
MALHIRGDARCAEGEESGIADLQEALRLARASGDAAGIALSESYLAEWRSAMDGPASGLAHYESALAITERRGLVVANLWVKGGSLWSLFDMGDWDRTLRTCEEMLAAGPEVLDGSLDSVARIVRSRIALLRGRREDAESAEALLAAARPLEELQAVVPALVVSAEIAFADGKSSDAVDLLEEFAEITRDVAAQYRGAYLAAVARLAVRAGALPLAERLVEESRGVVRKDLLNVSSARAVVAEATGDPAAAVLYAEAADGWRTFGDPLEEAEALFGVARCSPDGEKERRRAERLLAKLGVPVD